MCVGARCWLAATYLDAGQVGGAMHHVVAALLLSLWCRQLVKGVDSNSGRDIFFFFLFPLLLFAAFV